MKIQAINSLFSTTFIKQLFTLPLFLSATLSSTALYANTLTGVVFLSEDHGYAPPAENAKLILENNNEKIKKQKATTTDENGRFVFSDILPGSYTLKVIYPSYSYIEKEVIIENPNTNQKSTNQKGTDVQKISIVLLENKLPVSEVINVFDRAVEKESVVAYSNIARQDLELEGKLQDVPVMLSQLPSTLYYSENGNGIGYNYLTLRGFNQTRISVMVDGVPQNDPEDHNVYWINFADLNDNIEDIQIQRGAGSSFYGPPSIGGSINIATKMLDPLPYSKFTFGYGSFNTQKYSAAFNSGLLKNNLFFTSRLSHLKSDGYRNWSWASLWRAYLAMGYQGKKHSLKFQAYGGPQKDALAYYGIPKEYNSDELLRKYNYGAESNERSGDKEFFNQMHFDLIHNYEINDKLLFQQTLFYISGKGYFDFDGSWGDPYYFRIDESKYPNYYLDSEDPENESIPIDTIIRAYVNNKQIGLLPRLTWFYNNKIDNKLTFGVELRTHNSHHWGRIQEGSFSEEAKKDLVGETADRHYYDYHAGKDILSPYIHEHFEFGKAKVDANIQLSRIRYSFFNEAFVNNEFQVSYTFLNPKLGLSYKFTPNLYAFISSGYTQREPRLKELYDAENSSYGTIPMLDNVQPEKLFDNEIGLEITTPRLNTKITAFLMNFKDEIVKTGGLDHYGQPYYGNAEKSRHLGIELESGVRIYKGLDLKYNLSWNNNRFISFKEYVDDSGTPISRDGNVIGGSPEVYGNIGLQYVYEGFYTSFHGKYLGSFYTDHAEGKLDDNTSADGKTTVDPSFLLGAKFAYKFSKTRLKGLALSFEANNILNQKALLMGEGVDNFFPVAPLNFFFNLSYER